MNINAKRFPILARLLADGTVFIEKGQYIGRASAPSIMAPEGLVGIGAVGDEKHTESYLRRFPSPKDW